jgi:hypothetical protein
VSAANAGRCENQRYGALAKLFFSFSKGGVHGDVLEHRHPAADLKANL